LQRDQNGPIGAGLAVNSALHDQAQYGFRVDPVSRAS
jgi:hypothetical protein